MTDDLQILTDSMRSLLARVWQEGYRAGADDWPSCAVACGACDECQSEIASNPYRREGDE